MYTFGLVADPDAALNPLRDRLAAALGEHGAIALVTADGSVDAPSTRGVTTRYRLDGDRWRATGDGSSLDAVLDRLAPTHDYALVTGRPAADLPHVVVGDPDYDGEVLLRAASADAVAPDAVREALDGTEPRTTLASLIEAAKEVPEADRAGAVATFTGRVRARDDPGDTPTTHLEFEKYAGVAAERLADIREDLEAREGVFAVRMHHRTGVIEAGEDIVFVVVLAGHREEAFRTVSDGIDRLKDEVPIFKKEVTVEEDFWKHERQ